MPQTDDVHTLAERGARLLTELAHLEHAALRAGFHKLAELLHRAQPIAHEELARVVATAAATPPPRKRRKDAGIPKRKPTPEQTELA